MPEAEDVITDVARTATIFARDLWQRHRAGAQPRHTALSELAPRLDVFIAALFGRGYTLKSAQPPAPRTFLSKVFQREALPEPFLALPSTDGESIYLPPRIASEPAEAVPLYRAMALQQAARAKRGTILCAADCETPLMRDLYLLIEAQCAEAELAAMLPGLAEPLTRLRRHALAQRPSPGRFRPIHRPLELHVRALLAEACARTPHAEGPVTSLELARSLALDYADVRIRLFKDWWTGELRTPARGASQVAQPADEAERPDTRPARSARLVRRPEIREAEKEEDDAQAGAWMVQTSHPHEQAEDPFGMQRPSDRDQSAAAEEFADALSELPEARLVRTPEKAKEILLSEQLDIRGGHVEASVLQEQEKVFSYPEWDYALSAYRTPGAHVHVTSASQGPQSWVDSTLAEHGRMLDAVRRQFDMLRAQRKRQRKRLDGEEVDVDAYTSAMSDYRAGLPLSQAFYQSTRRARRDMAICLLIDISGSTDAWVDGKRRIIDVEREALLTVAAALQSMRERYAILAFSGEGPGNVRVRNVKTFEETYGNPVALRIAGLEPEHYTRVGAALRHATAALMRQPAHHRLLLLLSDGKPNDVDQYEGRYGVEDLRQAVAEARLQGVQPFCLTVDRQAPTYLPRTFGAHQYALLNRPERLPVALLEWLKRLLAS